MSACNYLAPNGEPSLLYAALEQEFGPEIAEQAWYRVQSDGFKTQYGDWTKPRQRKVPRDKNGEPTFEWVREKLQLKTTPKELPSPGPVKPIILQQDMFLTDGATENAITKRIQALYKTAAENPEKVYQVPFKRNHPGIKTPAGRMSMTRLAELFLQFPVPFNVQFDATFEGLMSVTPTRILQDIQITIPTLIPVKASILEDERERALLKVRDEYGRATGQYFSYERQQEAIDSIVFLVYSRFLKGVTQVSDVMNSVKQTLQASITRHLEIAAGKKFRGFEGVTKEMAEQRAENLQRVLNAFYVQGESNHLWAFTLKRLQLYGLNIYDYNSSEDPQPRELVDQNDGLALRDYRDSSFGLDKKDTASSRIKLFLSSIESTDDRRTVKLSFSSALVRENILTGNKTITVRTPQQAAELGLRKGETAVIRIDGKLVKITSLGEITSPEAYYDAVADEGIEPVAGMTAYQLELSDSSSELAIQKNFLGLPKLIPFKDTFQKLMALFADQEPSWQNFSRLMREHADPTIRRVAERLSSAAEPEQLRNEFVSVMSNQYQEFTMVLYGQEQGKDGITRMQTRSFTANFSSQVKVLLRSWEESQKLAPIARRDDTGAVTINQELAAELLTRLATINQELQDGKKDVRSKQVQLFKDVMAANGIELPDAFYKAFIKHVADYTKGTKLQGDFNRQFQFNQDGTAAGVISALIARLNGKVKEAADEDDGSFQVNNPMYTEGTAMNILARAALPHVPMVYSNSHRSGEGKSIYDHGLHTSLTHKLRRLKTDEQARLQKLSTFINEHNPLLRALNTDQELRDRFQITYMDSIKAEYIKGAGGTSRSDMSFREQLLYSMALFEKRGNKRYADYISLTHSDKTTTPIFLNGPRIAVVTGQKIVNHITGPVRTQGITDEVYKAFYNIFLDEYNRITRTTESYNADQFDKGKKFFYAMPEFNHDNMKKLLERGVITKAEFNALWTDLGALKPVETPAAKQLLLKLFNRRIDTLWKRTHSLWRREGLLTNESVPFSLRYMNRLLYNIGITADTLDDGKMAYFKDGAAITNEQAIQAASVLAARDYAVNHFLFNVSVSRMLYGDPAEVFKGDVATTLIEYTKRLAKDIAPGKDGEWSHSPTYSAITVEDWEGGSAEVQELVLAYSEEVNATDAQELITVQEYLDGKLAIGQISKQVYDEMTQIIRQAKGGYYEFTKPEHKIIMQPQKPVYVGEGALDRGVILTHYIKSSAYPLLPAFTVGRDLDQIRTMMERKGIARLNFKSAKKIGRPAAKVRMFDKNGALLPFDDAAIEANRQVLDRRGFRIQQEIPHGKDKRKIGIVTQMNKLIVQGLATITEPFTFMGNQVTVQAIMNARTDLRKTMFDLQKAKVYEKMGVSADGSQIENFDKLYDVLLQEATTRPGYTVNDIELLRYRDKDGKPLMPLLFSPSRARFESLLMNTISQMTEMEMYGRSFIQASAAGIRRHQTELTEQQKKHVVYVGDYRGEDLKMLRKENGEVKPAQVLVPFNFYSGNKKIDLARFITTTEDGTQVIDHEKLPKELLQLVAARIPNQGHSSMLPVEIVGFLPDEMGDTIIVPAAITKQMGSDFDVDKLFTYQRPYRYSGGRLYRADETVQRTEDRLGADDDQWQELKRDTVRRLKTAGYTPDAKGRFDKEIFNQFLAQAVQERYPDGNVPKHSVTIGEPEGPVYEDQLLNNYFEVHWSVLMHPQMTERVLSPLDRPDLKLEAARVPQSEESDYFDVIEQLESFQSQKFAKQLVGFTALSLTNNAVYEPLNVYLARHTMDDEGKIKVDPYAINMVDVDGQVHELRLFSGNGESTNYDIDGAPKRSKHDNITTVLSGFLDHAKEPVTPQINLNLYTYNAAAALLRLQSRQGVAPGIPELAAFLRQPVLMEYSRSMGAGNDGLSTTFEPDLHEKVMNELFAKYLGLAGAQESPGPAELEIGELRDDASAITSDFSAESFAQLNKGKPFFERQVRILHLFDILWKAGAQLADVQSAFNWDVGGPGPSILQALNREDAINDTRGARAMPDGVVIENLESMYDTEQGHIRGELLSAIRSVALQVFPYDKLMPLVEGFKKYTGSRFVSPKVMEQIVEGYLAFQWTHAPVWDTDEAILAERVRLLFTGAHGQSLARRLQDARHSWGRGNYLLQRIDSNINVTGNGPDFISYALGLSSDFDAAEIARSWTELLTSDDEVKKRLGEDLVRYAIITGNNSTLARHIPVSYLLGTSFLQATEQLQEGEAVPDIFMRQFIQHNPQYAASLSEDLRETGHTYEDYPESFKVLPINLEQGDHPGKKLWIRNPTIGYSYPQFLSYRDKTTNRWILYEQVDYLKYERIDTLGNNQVDEYSRAVAESAIPENRAYRNQGAAASAQLPEKQGMIDTVPAVKQLPEIKNYGLSNQGGYTELLGALSAIHDDTRQPGLYRMLSGMLALKPRNSLEKQILGIDKLPPFRFEVRKLPEGFSGYYEAGKNLLTISPGLKNDYFSEVLIHELIHYHTTVTTTMFTVEDNQEYFKTRYSEKEFAELSEAARDLKKELPDVYAKVRAIDQLRAQALNALRAEYKGKDFDRLYEIAVTSRFPDNLTNEQKRVAQMIYAFASTAEFVSHIFTDKDVMRWLNARKAEGDATLWEKLLDLVSSLLRSVAEFMGLDVEQGSMLEAGIKKSMELLYMQNNIPPTTTVMPANLNPDAFRNAVIAPVTAPPAYKKLAVLVARLEDQRREIAQTFTGTITKEQAARKRKMLDELTLEITRLKDEQDLTLVAELGKTQLRWVTEIMNREKPDANDIMVADRILELWTNLITVMYGDNNNLARIDEEWSKIASDAQLKRQQLTTMAIDRMIAESDNILRKSDFGMKELEDPSWAQVRMRSLSASAKSKALQYIGTYLEQTGRMVNEEVLRVLKETRQLEEDFIKYAGGKKNVQAVYNKLMQENKTGTAWGLVRLFSGTWYMFLSDTKAKREHRIDVINRDKGYSAKQKADLKKVAWEDYWKQVHSQAYMVDTRQFFDEYGKDKADIAEPWKELVAAVGSEEQARKTLDKARERYHAYLEEKETLKDMLEADVKNGIKSRQQADAELQEYIGRYSPNTFFNNHKNQFLQFNVNTTDRFVVTVPRAKHEKYFDKKYKELQQDPELLKLYHRLHNLLTRMRSYLPKSVQYELGENFLPVVAKALVSDISDVPGYVKGMPERFVRSLTATAFEEQNMGQERIPISYVDTTKSKDPSEIAGRSRDLVKITELFSAMAVHYRHFAAAKDVIDMGQSIIREIDRTRSRDGKIVDEDGKVVATPQRLQNALDALQYMKEYMMYKRAKQLEGNAGVKVYSLNPKKQLQIAARVKELTIKAKKLDDDLMDGTIDGDEWNAAKKEIDDELSTYEGRPIYGSKVGDKLISIQQAKALAFNPFSGIANFTFGIVSGAVYANGRTDFGWSEYRQALRTMMSSTAKWVSFGNVIPDQARKIMNTMDRLGVMGDVVDSQYGKLQDRQRIPNWKKTIDPYNWLRSGDYFCRGLHTVAVLLKEKVKVQTPGGEKEVTLWEALDNDGQWNEQKYGKRPEWFSEDVTQQKEWNRVRNKIARVNMIIMGNVDRNSPKMANKWLIGRLLGQFRLSWLPEGWYNRWGEERPDMQLGRNIKGRYTTAKELGIGGTLRILGKQYLSVVAKVDPYSGEHRLDGEKISEADIENMRKNFAELNFYLLILGAIMMLRSLGGDDDDDESASMQMLINMIIRVKQDVAFYSSPEVFDTVTRNAIPAFGVVKDYMRLMDASWKVMTEDDYTADRWLLKLTKAGLPIPQATLINKIRYMQERDLDDLAR